MFLSQKIKIFPYKEFLLITLLTTIIVVIFFYIGNLFTNGLEFIVDSSYYLKMSYNPFTFISAPYSYRLLTPLLVYLLPLEHYIGFIVVNLTAYICTTVLFYYYLKKLNFTTPYIILGSLFFLLSPTILYSIVNVTLIDALSYLFYLLSFYAILTKNDKLFLISLIFGVLNKETMLLTIPLFFMFKLDKGILKALKSTILISLPALLLFLYVRYALGFINYLSWETISNIILYHLSSLSLFNSPYPAFGTLWIIALLNLSKNNNPFIKKTIYLLPLIIMQLFIATDTYRLLFLAFPIIIPLSLYLNINENTKRILMLLILSIIILISYSVFFNVSTIPNILILIFLPLEILITGFLLILLYKKNLINKK